MSSLTTQYEQNRHRLACNRVYEHKQSKSGFYKHLSAIKDYYFEEGLKQNWLDKVEVCYKEGVLSKNEYKELRNIKDEFCKRRLKK